jgi:alkyl hydroperoxide reductase subunit AhpC
MAINVALQLNDIAPDFTADSSEGPLRFHEWLGEGYGILFSHPRDCTPVCTSEFIAASDRVGAFAALGTKLIGLSVDPIEDHLRWKADIERFMGRPLGFALVADPRMKIARSWGMLPAEPYIPEDEDRLDPVTDRLDMVLRSGADEVRLFANTRTVRSTYVIGPDRRIRLSHAYPMSVGRDFDELLRALQAVQTADRFGLNTPAGWQPGEAVLVPAAMSTEAAEARFGPVTAHLPYFRSVKPPR